MATHFRNGPTAQTVALTTLPMNTMGVPRSDVAQVVLPAFDQTHADLRDFASCCENVVACQNLQPDGASVDSEMDRRAKHVRLEVLATCCRVLNPLAGLSPHGDHKLAELMLRCGEAQRLRGLEHVPNVLVLRTPGDNGSAPEMMQRLRASVASMPLDRGLQRMLLDSVDLCLAEATSLCREPAAQVRAAMAQLVVALRCLRPGGTLLLKMQSLEGALVTGILYAVMRWFFTGAVTLCKPQASRPSSREVYLVALGHTSSQQAPPRVLEWLERAAQSTGTPATGEVSIMQPSALEVPYEVPEEFRCCVEYFAIRYILLRQRTTKHAQELCRVITEHQPLVHAAQLVTLLDSCIENAALCDRVRNHMQEWPLKAIGNSR